MTAYYNEFDPFAAQWLRNLIYSGLIAPGVVDERSITDVSPSDLKGFKQCHFFAGIGGWSYALRLAGIPDNFPCWTGSPPCQPFSTAGKQLAQNDSRHLAPTFVRLVIKCRPSILFGEQVRAAINKFWLDDLFDELEKENYACASAVLPASGVGAYHKRERICFGATVGNSDSSCWEGFRESEQFLLQKGWEDEKRYSLPANVASHFWSEWEPDEGADGQVRMLPPGYGDALNGVSARVGRVRGFGNAIVPPLAAEFIKAFVESVSERNSIRLGGAS
ncbi:DNA (cytosine-5)-methyltransferase 1 [Lelliottia sp. 489]|uniref:DNA cytosine methyltransferase n=1 Tax=Lelliottia sp. 489 TaxID=3156448 RepID=UPI003D1C85B7